MLEWRENSRMGGENAHRGDGASLSGTDQVAATLTPSTTLIWGHLLAGGRLGPPIPLNHG